jgi:hypothetical protein
VATDALSPRVIPDPLDMLTAGDITSLMRIHIRTFRRLRVTGQFPPPDFVRGKRIQRWRRSTVDRAMNTTSERN